jgi:hypothetical protein
LAPVIIATDKTSLTNFSGGKTAYPVYLTLGNIPKAKRRKLNHRACILIAYLPVDKALPQSGDVAADIKCKTYQLFHDAMRVVLQPLIEAGKQGVELTDGKGEVRMVHPVIAAYVADYPEQCLVTLAKYGTCPRCQVSATELQNKPQYDARTRGFTMNVIRDARLSVPGGDRKRRRKVHTKCMEKDVAGGTFDPFWVNFPLTCDIHRAMTPDILHQLYQGVVVHLIHWIQGVMTEAELDRRIRLLAPTFGVRHFKNGISALKQVSGTERKHIAKILLACLAPVMPKQGIQACKAIIDFIYLAQYPSHDDETLGYMREALEEWEKHRNYFIDEGTREHFNIPKFHSLNHYIDSIRYLGTTDNFNTELFERLHIDFAKEGWRASNKRNHFPQMIKWLSRKEKISSFDYYLSEADGNEGEVGNKVGEDEEGPEELHTQSPMADRMDLDSSKKASIFLPAYSISKYPSASSKSLTQIMASHDAPQFVYHLKEFLNSRLPPNQRYKKSDLRDFSLPFTALAVWHQFKVQPHSLDSEVNVETVKAIPLDKNSQNDRFDTVVVMVSDEAESTSLTG